MRLPSITHVPLWALIALTMATGARAEQNVLQNLSNRELISQVSCEGTFQQDFCTLVQVFDTPATFQLWIDRCHADLSVEALYEQPHFACTPKQSRYNAEPMGLLSHLSIRFIDANTLTREAFRDYLEQGRPEAFSALLNRTDAQGRTHLDILDAREKEGTYIGTQLGGMTDRKSYACSLGGRYAKQPQPANCQRRDRLFSQEFIQRARQRATP